ncbi:MAG: restriction endonuclease subunit S [Fibrobacter sp.]|nr:restriction endonuclease subunit S [Fibrobacter sp.]
MMLPNGWKKVRLSELGTFSKGSGIKRDEANSGSIPAIRYGEIYTAHNDYIKQFQSFISEKVAKEATLLKNGDLLFSCSGETKEDIGKCVAFVSNERAYAGGDIIILSPTVPCDSKYIGFLCNSSFVNKQRYSFAQGDSIVHISSESIGKIEIPFPPLNEQKKIAATLSVWDSAIEKMEKLIEAKENELNIVLRQNSLEKGIALKWKEIPLTEILKSVTPPSKIHQDSYLNSGKFPIVDQSKDLIAGWTNDESSVLKINRPLIIFGDHTCALKIMHMPFAQGADGIKILSAKNGYDPTYIYYAIKANPVIPEGYKRHFSALMLKSILCPSLEEQKKYAVYFKSLDEEISLLKQQLENYKKQKQGLMQKLLTGQWRVK